MDKEGDVRVGEEVSRFEGLGVCCHYDGWVGVVG
jgi:hypothetical protein